MDDNSVSQFAFDQILILLAVSVLVVALMRRMHLPPILGYLGVGVLVGTPSLTWISMSRDTHGLAEFGVVFLMFTIGLEFSLRHLLAMKTAVLGLGGAQMAICTLIAGLTAWLLGMSPQGALVVGGALALSSTAIVVKQLTEQGEINSAHGRLTMAVLLFQDLAVIPFLVIIPVLASKAEGGVLLPLLMVMLEGTLAITVLYALGHWLLRPLLRAIAARHSSELFMLTVLLVTLGAAWATQQAGMSMALGAFLAGMLIGETEFRHQVEADIRPFQDVLLGLFFITIGMRLDVSVLASIWYWVLLLTALIIVLKTAVVMGLSILVKSEPAVALRTGLSLAQGGEFSFVLLSLAFTYGLMDGPESHIVLAAILLSMALSPFLIRYNGQLAKRLFAMSYRQDSVKMGQGVTDNAQGLNQHIIICGYGRVGQNIARFLEQEGFDYVALDLDPLRVRQAQAAGDRVSYGDSARREILLAAGLNRARALLVSYHDLAVSLKVLEHVRSLRPDLPVLVRATDDSELETLLSAGVTEVVPETLEASLMLASQLLLILGVPVTRVVRRVREVRHNRYRFLRGIFYGEEHYTLEQPESQSERLHSLTLPPGAFGIGHTLEQLGLTELGVTVTAVRRNGIRGPEPEPYTKLREGDVLILYGTPRALEAAEPLLLGG